MAPIGVHLSTKSDRGERKEAGRGAATHAALVQPSQPKEPYHFTLKNTQSPSSCLQSGQFLQAGWFRGNACWRSDADNALLRACPTRCLMLVNLSPRYANAILLRRISYEGVLTFLPRGVFAKVVLGVQPISTIVAPSSALIGSSVSVKLTFANPDSDAGYSPFLDFVLPSAAFSFSAGSVSSKLNGSLSSYYFPRFALISCMK